MPNVSVIPQTASASRMAILYQAEGILGENFPAASGTTATALTSQRVYGALLGLRVGDSVTGIGLRLTVSAAGTAPVLGRFGVADATGKIVALSSDLGAATNWTAGAATFALASPYAVTAQGGYFACFVVNGTWGTTQPAVTAAAVSSPAGYGAFPGGAMPVFTWDGQTDLPAVGASLTMATAAQIRYMAFYGSGSV